MSSKSPDLRDVEYITKTAKLEALCAAIEEAGLFGIDTEFHREHTYRPHLCLIQVAVGDRIAIVDPLAPGMDLSSLHRLLLDPDVRQVAHSCTQDLEIFYRATGKACANTFDTQIAAALVGHGDQVGYANLVQQLVGAKLSKAETLSDWQERPLSDQQLAYAADDVRHLLEVHERLAARLEELGRTEWAEEEFRPLSDASRFEPDADRLFRRVRGGWHLSRRGLAILRELVVWREERAIEENVPRNRIARDDALMSIAKRVPRSARDVKGQRGLGRSVKDRCDDLVAAVERGQAVAESDLPESVDRPDSDAWSATRVDLLWAYVRGLAVDLEIGPQTLVTREVLGRIQDTSPGTPDDLAALPELAGWRAGVLAGPLFDLLTGRRAIALGRGRQGPPLELLELEPDEG